MEGARVPRVSNAGASDTTQFDKFWGQTLPRGRLAVRVMCHSGKAL